MKLANKHDGLGWPKEKVIIVENCYRMFLFLCRKYPSQRIVPTKEIDDFWHAHILDTKKYIRDCKIVFRRYLHHFPYAGLRGERDRDALKRLYRHTMQLVNKEFPSLMKTQ